VRSYLKSRGRRATSLTPGLQELSRVGNPLQDLSTGMTSLSTNWLNDMDLRDIIAGAIRVASEELRHSVSTGLNRRMTGFAKLP